MTLDKYGSIIQASKRKRLFLFLGIENILIGFFSSLIGPLLPIICRDLNVTFSRMGIILSLSSFGALIIVLITGSVLEIFPNRLKKTGELCCILIALTLAGIYFAWSFPFFTLFYFISTLAVSGFSIVHTIMLHDLYDIKLGSVLLKMNMLFLIGYTTGPFVISIFLNFNLNWRYLFIFASFLQSALFIYLTFLKFEPKSVVDNKKGFIFYNIKKIALNKKIITCFFISLLYGGLVAIAFNWMTAFLMEKGIPVKTGSIFVGFLSFSMIIGSLSKIILLKFMKETSIILLNSIGGIIFIILFFQTDNIILKIILLMLFGINVTAITALTLPVSIKAIPDIKSSITGIIISSTYIGSIVFQYATGRFLDNYGGISIIYIILIGLGLLITASVILLVIDRNKDYERNIVFKFFK